MDAAARQRRVDPVARGTATAPASPAMAAPIIAVPAATSFERKDRRGSIRRQFYLHKMARSAHREPTDPRPADPWTCFAYTSRGLKNYAAAEIYGDRCRLVGVRPGPGGAVVMAHDECDLNQDAVVSLREFRRGNNLDKHLRIILWPRIDDAGVTAISARTEEELPFPTTVRIRERVTPLVHAGFRVAGVSLPHQVLAELAMQHGARLAVTLAFHADGGCVALAHHGHSGPRPAYLRWDAVWCLATAGSGNTLDRYEFAAAFAPHVRQLIQGLPPGPVPILACGSMPNLRTAMAPFSEEFGRYVQVLDHPWPGMLDAEAGTIPTEPAVWQLARAAAQSAAMAHSR